MDLDAWLRVTNRVRENHHFNDAWNEGNTDCAFRINDATAVQRSHSSNDWNFWAGDLAQVCMLCILCLLCKTAVGWLLQLAYLSGARLPCAY
jgi:hypothetical protein